MGDRISSAEYSIRLYARDPWGDRTATVLLSHLITLTLNLNRDGNKHPEPYTPDEVLPPILPPLKKPEPVVVANEAQSFMAAMRM